MAWELARNDEYRIDALDVAGTGVARSEPLGGGGDPAQPIVVKCHRCGIFGGALLDLDEGKSLAAPGDEVDLAASDPRAPRENAPAVEPQPPRGEIFGAAPARFGCGALQRSSANCKARA